MSEIRPARCPICKKPTAEETRPFCSKRCRDVDLSRWLGDGYVIAGGNADADEDGDDAGLSRSGSPPQRSDIDDEDQ